MSASHWLPPFAPAGSTFDSLEDKVFAALAGAVIADALGAPTEQRSIAEIKELFGGTVEQFYKPPTDSPYAKGRKAGQYTDDSSQMLMLSDILIENEGELTAEDIGNMIVEWSKNPEYFPHFAGPSTRRAIEALREGADPNTLGAEGRVATMGASNGAAMRVSPIGLINPGNVQKASEMASITCRPSHFTSIGVSSAAAIASAVAVALRDDATILDVVRAALEGADIGNEIGASEGREVAGALVRNRTELAVKIASTSPDLETAIKEIAETVGTGLHASEAVPAAIGFFVAAGGDPWLTAVAAANAGDDTDTVGAMAAAVAGAYSGSSAIPLDKLAEVEAANDLDLAPIAEKLAAIARRNLQETTK